MTDATRIAANTLFIEVTGAGLPEVDGLYVPSEAPPAKSPKYSGRAHDNIEAMKKRFDTFKTETLPTVELFKSNGKCIEIDTSQDREAVYPLLREQLAEHTDPELMAQPLSEQAETLLRPYPREAP